MTAHPLVGVFERELEPLYKLLDLIGCDDQRRAQRDRISYGSDDQAAGLRVAKERRADDSRGLERAL